MKALRVRGRRHLVSLIAWIGLACALLITLASPGATRMYATPWNFAYGAALVAPVLLLIWRSSELSPPLVLPPVAWQIALVGATVVILLSALFSPYREPSLLWSAPLLAACAVFLVGYDWVHRVTTDPEQRRTSLQRAILLAFTLIALVSVGMWLAKLPYVGAGDTLASRNPFPLGHANYTAGLAILGLPVALVEMVRGRAVWRFVGGATSVLALVMLFTSGSRGGLIGLAGVSIAGMILAPWSARRKFQFAIIALVIAVIFALAHPRIRASILPGRGQLVAASDVQRNAMFMAGIRMGTDRPLVGWGPGTTPLVYPKYRATLAGGAENVLQLHSTPVQVWAELGLLGTACFLGLCALTLADARHSRTFATALIGYGFFALTDWQLDVPVFGFTAALLAAATARPPVGTGVEGSALPHSRVGLAFFSMASLALVVGLGRTDPAPALNVRALATASEPLHAADSVAMLRQSLGLNPDQEIAHFNLGWLLLVREPANAEQHFAAAANLVPDKGGVYLGLALARLNQGRPEAAAQALALECINDPAFLLSPWWREPGIAALRDETARAFARNVARARILVPTAASQLEELVSCSATLGEVPVGPEKVYRRKRSGYPVLMRQLDLPAPVDLYDVRELAVTDRTRVRLAKGWLPSPALRILLAEASSPKS